MATAGKGAALDSITRSAFLGSAAKRIGSLLMSAFRFSLRVQVDGSIAVVIWLHACSIRLEIRVIGVPDTLHFFPARLSQSRKHERPDAARLQNTQVN